MRSLEQALRSTLIDWLGPMYDAEARYGASNPDYIQPDELDTLITRLLTLLDTEYPHTTEPMTR